MASEPHTTERIPGYCALCISRCGSIAVVEDGRFVRLEPDPSHPTGQALCAKGRAAPELVYSPDRLLYPLKRTRPKGDPDPGWQRINWDEAQSLVQLRPPVVEPRGEHGWWQVSPDEHGWWQVSPEIGAPGYDPFSPDGSNFNLLIGNAAIDPVSGSVPHRAYVCQISRAD